VAYHNLAPTLLEHIVTSPPTSFFFFLSRLLHNSSDVRHVLLEKERIVARERFDAEADPLSLASQIIAACIVNIVDH
jgi:hypothetical protein